MPAFGDVLAPADVDRLIEVVKAFDPAAFRSAPAPVALGTAPPPNRERGAALWPQLGCDRCHGAAGRGDGPAAKTMAEPPYDLVAEPLRRPRATDDLDARRRATALSIATGLAGTTMPGYAGQIAAADVWALADRVIAIERPEPRVRVRGEIDADEIAADRSEVATWPGDPADPDARVFGAAVAPQGAPLAALAPAQASLDARQCGRCHAKQLREWSTTLHASAFSAGLVAQIDHGAEKASECQRCHAPLAEQLPGGDGVLRAEGVQCAGCHVRAWVRRGPPRVAPSLMTAPGYPLEELPIYERSDLCLACHQLPAKTALAGRPLLNTYKEWLESPYLARGIQCQHCHMPNREHTWRGVHDPTTFRQGIQLAATAHRNGDAITVTAELRNIGAGHDLPTTPTPAVWLSIQLVDARGRSIEGATAKLRIGRDVFHDRAGWHERADTRLLPGETRTMARAWSAGRTAEAAAARVTVEVWPDDYYERFYADQLAAHPDAAARALYETALARARSSHYIAEQRDLPIALPSR